MIQTPILMPGELNSIGDKSASSFDQCWYVLNSRKHGIKTTSKHDPKHDPACEKYKKVGKKEKNEANCINLFTVTPRLQLINCFKRRTSHELNFITRFQLSSFLRAVKYNFNILANSQMQCSHVIQTQAQKCDGMHINFDAVYQGHSKCARETSKTQTALIGSGNLLGRAKSTILMRWRTIYTSAHTQVFKIH